MHAFWFSNFTSRNLGDNRDNEESSLLELYHSVDYKSEKLEIPNNRELVKWIMIH